MATASSPGTTTTRHSWVEHGVTLVVTFFMATVVSAVTMAFPSIQRDFDVSRTGLSWVISGHNIVVGPFCWCLADSIGRRKVFVPGVAVFGLVSLASALGFSSGPNSDRSEEAGRTHR